MQHYTREQGTTNSRMGRDTRASSQVYGGQQYHKDASDDERLTADNETQAQFIPIRRNSRFYTSMRGRNRQRRDRLNLREGTEMNSPNSGQQGHRDPRSVRVNADTHSSATSTKHREYGTIQDSNNPSKGTASPAECAITNPAPSESWKKLLEQIELLYQEYRDKSNQQEIQARRLQDNYVQTTEAREGTQTIDKGEDSPPAIEHRRANSSFSSLQSSCSGFNLWQDLPVIKNSNVLDILKPEEIKLQEAMFELVTSEASYYKSLCLLVSHFMESERLKATLHQSEMHFIFSNVLEVTNTSESFLLDLEQRLEKNIVISDVCDIVYKHAANHFGVYVTYVCNQTYQERAYRKLLQERTEFREAVGHLETNSICRGLPFASFLILPFQRITRLKLLVQNILTKVEEGSERESSALQAHRELEKLVRSCNEGVRKMSRTEQLISIEKTLEFKIKSVPIISHSRWLLKQGELQQMSGPRTSRTLRTKKLFRPVYLFLFNDLLLMCKRLAGERYQVFDVAARGLLRVEELEDQGQSLANVFMLKLLENAFERESTYMLKATSQSEMKRWMTSLVPNRRTKFVSITSKLVDCPQVQCVHPYVSQEPDELSLDLAEILNVLDKTDDGWVFGERLHDQEKGWFPSTVAEEILNRDLRTQNLKQCIRVYKQDDGSQNKDRRKMGSRTRQ